MAKKETTTKESKTTKEEKKFRLLKNPEQTADMQTYYAFGTEAIVVPKEGYHFSLDKEMDKTIEYLIEELGFVEVK